MQSFIKSFLIFSNEKDMPGGNSLVVQGSGLSTFTTMAWGSIPGQRTKTLQASRYSKKKKVCTSIGWLLPKDMPRIYPLQKRPFLHNVIHHSTICNCQEGGRAQWPSTDEWIKTGVDIHWSVIQPSNKEKSGR